MVSCPPPAASRWRSQDLRKLRQRRCWPWPGFRPDTCGERPEAPHRFNSLPVGGTQIAKWQKGQRLYQDAVRRAKLALEQGPKGKTRIAVHFWLQGEADSSTAEKIERYPTLLSAVIKDIRADLELPELPFIACTIGELRDDSKEARAAINRALLELPDHVPHTACVDSRSFAADIGDRVHFDTATQEEHGRRFAAKYLELTK